MCGVMASFGGLLRGRYVLHEEAKEVERRFSADAWIYSQASQIQRRFCLAC